TVLQRGRFPADHDVFLWRRRAARLGVDAVHARPGHLVGGGFGPGGGRNLREAGSIRPRPSSGHVGDARSRLSVDRFCAEGGAPGMAVFHLLLRRRLFRRSVGISRLAEGDFRLPPRSGAVGGVLPAGSRPSVDAPFRPPFHGGLCRVSEKGYHRVNRDAEDVGENPWRSWAPGVFVSGTWAGVW